MTNHQWTVKDLKDFLSKVPEDVLVFFCTSEYKGATSSLRAAEYNEKAGWGITPNSVVLG